MAPIDVSVEIDAPPEQVWEAVSDLASHTEWMADARAIHFESEARTGAGTRIRVLTGVGPFRTSDVMEVTEWVEGERIGVIHRGLVNGQGRFQLESADGATRFTWSEDLTFPWWLGGPLAAWAARPILRRIWRRNLAGLKSLLEGAS